MAEGLLRQLAGDRFESLSAGTRPTTLNPMAVRALAEIGVDISVQRSKAHDAFADSNVDVVITVCDRANESCPVYNGATARLHWSFDDPAEARGTDEQRMSVFRRVRDQIHDRILKFLETGGGHFE